MTISILPENSDSQSRADSLRAATPRQASSRGASTTPHGRGAPSLPAGGLLFRAMQQQQRRRGVRWVARGHVVASARLAPEDPPPRVPARARREPRTTLPARASFMAEPKAALQPQQLSSSSSSSALLRSLECRYQRD